MTTKSNEMRMLRMAIENLHNFLIDYFESNQCVVEADQDKLTIELTEEMDERLMNRPFYWHYVRKLNQQGQPLQLKLTTNFSKATKEIDYIYFTTDRFRKIAEEILEKGRFSQLYQKSNTTIQTPLYPWLIVTIKQTFLGKTQSERLHSYGIHLINGTIIDQAFSTLAKREWSMTVPNLCYPMAPLIKPINGFDRIEKYLINQLQTEEHQWASDSYQSLTEEIELLDYFKAHNPNMDIDHYQQEKDNLKSIYQPKIKLDVINGGLFYLRKD